MFLSGHFPGSNAELFYIKHRLVFLPDLGKNTGHKVQFIQAIKLAALSQSDPVGTKQKKIYITLTVCEDTLAKTTCIEALGER